jgi:hypothetical protein
LCHFDIVEHEENLTAGRCQGCVMHPADDFVTARSGALQTVNANNAPGLDDIAVLAAEAIRNRARDPQDSVVGVRRQPQPRSCILHQLLAFAIQFVCRYAGTPGAAWDHARAVLDACGFSPPSSHRMRSGRSSIASACLRGRHRTPQQRDARPLTLMNRSD